MTSDTLIQVPAELFATAESSHFDGKLPLEVLTIGPDDYRFTEAVTWEVEITNTGSALLVEGKATGLATCSCARCLEDATFDFEGDVEGYILLEAESYDEFEEDDELGADEFDVLSDDHMLDLEPMIRAALLVDAPTTPLCTEECKGLCPQCGANLNEGACDCGTDEALAEFDRAANPFSVLSQITFDE